MTGNKKGNRSKVFKRRRRRGNYLTVSGKYPSHQNQHSLYFEGFRERDLFVHLAFDDTVLLVEDHPIQIAYTDGNRQRTYRPDAKITFRPIGGGAQRPPIVAEVKVQAELDRAAETLEPAFAGAQDYCNANGMQFLVVTESVLARPAVRNLRFLYRYRLYKPEPTLLEMLKASLEQPGSRSLEAIIASLSATDYPAGKIIAATWHLVATKQASVDLAQPLSVRSELRSGHWSTSI